MTVSTILSMSLFALATSLSPGPVNLVGVNSGARFGIRAGLICCAYTTNVAFMYRAYLAK